MTAGKTQDFYTRTLHRVKASMTRLLIGRTRVIQHLEMLRDVARAREGGEHSPGVPLIHGMGDDSLEDMFSALEKWLDSFDDISRLAVSTKHLIEGCQAADVGMGWNKRRNVRKAVEHVELVAGKLDQLLAEFANVFE